MDKAEEIVNPNIKKAFNLIKLFCNETFQTNNKIYSEWKDKKANGTLNDYFEYTVKMILKNYTNDDKMKIFLYFKNHEIKINIFFQSIALRFLQNLIIFTFNNEALIEEYEIFSALNEEITKSLFLKFIRNKITTCNEKKNLVQEIESIKELSEIKEKLQKNSKQLNELKQLQKVLPYDNIKILELLLSAVDCSNNNFTISQEILEPFYNFKNENKNFMSNFFKFKEDNIQNNKVELFFINAQLFLNNHLKKLNLKNIIKNPNAEIPLQEFNKIFINIFLNNFNSQEKNNVSDNSFYLAAKEYIKDNSNEEYKGISEDFIDEAISTNQENINLVNKRIAELSDGSHNSFYLAAKEYKGISEDFIDEAISTNQENINLVNKRIAELSIKNDVKKILNYIYEICRKNYDSDNKKYTDLLDYYHKTVKEILESYQGENKSEYETEINLYFQANQQIKSHPDFETFETVLWQSLIIFTFNKQSLFNYYQKFISSNNYNSNSLFIDFIYNFVRDKREISNSAEEKIKAANSWEDIVGLKLLKEELENSIVEINDLQIVEQIMPFDNQEILFSILSTINFFENDFNDSNFFEIISNAFNKNYVKSKSDTKIENFETIKNLFKEHLLWLKKITTVSNKNLLKIVEYGYFAQEIIIFFKNKMELETKSSFYQAMKNYFKVNLNDKNVNFLVEVVKLIFQMNSKHICDIDKKILDLQEKIIFEDKSSSNNNSKKNQTKKKSKKPFQPTNKNDKKSLGHQDKEVKQPVPETDKNSKGINPENLSKFSGEEVNKSVVGLKLLKEELENSIVEINDLQIVEQIMPFDNQKTGAIPKPRQLDNDNHREDSNLNTEDSAKQLIPQSLPVYQQIPGQLVTPMNRLTLNPVGIFDEVVLVPVPTGRRFLMHEVVNLEAVSIVQPGVLTVTQILDSNLSQQVNLFEPVADVYQPNHSNNM